MSRHPCCISPCAPPPCRLAGGDRGPVWRREPVGRPPPGQPPAHRRHAPLARRGGLPRAGVCTAAGRQGVTRAHDGGVGVGGRGRGGADDGAAVCGPRLGCARCSTSVPAPISWGGLHLDPLCGRLRRVAVKCCNNKPTLLCAYRTENNLRHTGVG